MRLSILRRRQRLNLALEGGGAHGAFTWGVLDRLLEDETLEYRLDQRHQRRRRQCRGAGRGPGRGRPRRRARQAAGGVGGGGQGRRARPGAPQSAGSPASAARTRWRRWRRCSRPTTSIRWASTPSASCSRTHVDFARLRGTPRPGAAGRGHRRDDRPAPPVPPHGDHGRGGAGLGLPADAASCRDHRRPGLLGRRLLGQPGPADAGAREPGRRHADRQAQLGGKRAACR